MLFQNRVQSVIVWQADGVIIGKERQDQGLSIIWPPNALLRPQEEIGSHGASRKSAINPLYNPPKPKTESGHGQVNPTFSQP